MTTHRHARRDDARVTPTGSSSLPKGSWPASTCSRPVSSACSRHSAKDRSTLPASLPGPGSPTYCAHQRRRHGRTRSAGAAGRLLREHPGRGNIPVGRDRGRHASAAEVLGPAQLSRLDRPRRSARPWPPRRQIFDIDEELVPIMSAGIEAATAGACRALPAAAELPPASRVLDIGGGTGSWAIALAAGRRGSHSDCLRAA